MECSTVLDGRGRVSPVLAALFCGLAVGSAYPLAWIQEHPHIKAARALLDGCVLYRREVADVRYFAGAALEYGTSYLGPVLAEASAAPPAWLVTSA
eukprot:2478219-Heterocapsa_arctica.AAC.1